MPMLEAKPRSFVAHDVLRFATLLAIAVFLLDWTTKSWALATVHDATMPFGSFLLGVERNDAFAFSTGGGSVSASTVIAVRLLALIAVVYFSRRVVARSRRFAAGFAMLLGGGFGNAADVLFRGGAVVDFIGAGPFTFDWAGERVHLSLVFNTADIAILLGLVLILPHIHTWAVAWQRRISAWEARCLRSLAATSGVQAVRRTVAAFLSDKLATD